MLELLEGSWLDDLDEDLDDDLDDDLEEGEYLEDEVERSLLRLSSLSASSFSSLAASSSW